MLNGFEKKKNMLASLKKKNVKIFVTARAKCEKR